MIIIHLSIFITFIQYFSDFIVQETRVGYVNIKHSEGVLFILTGRKMRVSTGNSYKEVPILFEKEEFNIGRGMNVSTTVFTAPRTGLYEFRYSELIVPLSKKGQQSPTISLIVNKRPKSLAPIHPSYQSSSIFGEVVGDVLLVNVESLQMLKIGDQVELSIDPKGYMADRGINYVIWSKFASYSGRLVEEDLVF